MKHLKDNIEAVNIQLTDEVFKITKEALENNNVYHLLKGPVVHTGFRRLA